MTLAYPGKDSDLRQHTGWEFFIAALDDQDSEIKITERDQRNFQDAYIAALRPDAYQKARVKKTGTRKIVRLRMNIK